MRKKKPIVEVKASQNYVSGRNVSDKTNRDMNRIAKTIKK